MTAEAVICDESVTKVSRVFNPLASESKLVFKLNGSIHEPAFRDLTDSALG
jgi:hypothetical protein